MKKFEGTLTYNMQLFNNLYFFRQYLFSKSIFYYYSVIRLSDTSETFYNNKIKIIIMNN